ncbi:MAG: TetR/AcrR family transcriptional regulator [Pseudomonadota bacterium]
MTKNLHEFIAPCSKSAGRPKASDLEARTHDLLYAAGTLFLKHGYSKVSLEMIAREAHVAVRTIYVKFGGKAGLLNAVLEFKRDKFFKIKDMESSTLPFKEVVRDFAVHFHDLISAPEAISMQRMVVAEAPTNQELAHTFYEAGPKRTRDMLANYFARPEIRVQLRTDADPQMLAVHLLNCVMGDQFRRFLFEAPQLTREQVEAALDLRLSMFYDGVLRKS